MWLIKLHIAFSSLCALSTFGVSFLFRKEIEENGWGTLTWSDCKHFLAASFIPILNVMLAITVFSMTHRKCGGTGNGNAKT